MGKETLFVGSSSYRGHEGVSGATKDLFVDAFSSYFFIVNTPPYFVIVGGSHYIWKCLQFRKCCSQSPRRDITNPICDSRPHGDRNLHHAKKSRKSFSSHAQRNPSTCSLLQQIFPPSLLFLLFLTCLWAVTLLAVSGVVCCCPHAIDGGTAHIYFMLDIS